MTETITVNLTVTATPTAPRIPLNIHKDVSPSSLRKLVSEATKIPLDKLRLIFRGRLIGNDETKKAVGEFKLEEGSVLHCMGKPEGQEVAGNQPTAPAPSVTTTAGSTVTLTPNNNAASLASTTSTTSSSSDPLQQAFAKLRSSNPLPTYMTAVTTLEKILTNIVGNPMEDKYRRLKKQNAGFQKRLAGLTGGDEAMKASGFVIETHDDEEVYIMQASAENWPQLTAAKTAVEAAVRDAKAVVNQASAPAAGTPNFGGAGIANFGGAGIPNFGGAGLPGMFPGMGGPGGSMVPDMQAAAAQMMSDPNALQTMLQNPMVQTMVQNDPRFANNPMMRQSMEQLANNPGMVQQISQMMRDPNMQQQMQAMQSMMGGGAGGGMGGGDFGAGMPPSGAGMGAAGNNNVGQQNAPNNNNASGDNDQDQTEDEMIAEAIRRSLEEGGS